MLTEQEMNALRAGKLKLLRKAFGLSQREAAFMMDMDFLDYTYYELGRAAVSDALLVTAAKCYNVETEYMINDRIGLDKFKELLRIPLNEFFN